MDLCFNICSEKDDWEYLIGKLKERPREWNNKLIMDIQKHYLKNITGKSGYVIANKGDTE